MKKLKIDWKQMFLEKGEKIGLGVALALTILFFLLGQIWGWTSGSPGSNAEALQTLATTVSNRQRQAKLEKGDADYPPEMQKAGDFVALKPVNPDEYRTAMMFDTPRQTDTKRRNPTIMAPDEFLVKSVLTQLRSYDLTVNKATGKIEKVTVVEGADTGMGGGAPGMLGPTVASQNDYRKRLGSMGGSSLGPTTPEGPPGGMGRFGYPGYGPGMAPTAGTKNTIKSIPVDQLDKLGQSYAFAEKVWPLPMVIVAGSFPYKAQVEEFQRALRLNSPRAVINEVNQYGRRGKDGRYPASFQFRGLEVERIEVGPDGKPVKRLGKETTWTPIDFERTYKPVVVFTGKRFEEEDPSLADLMPISADLMMGLPMQFHQDRYPKLLTQLDTIKKTLKEIQEKAAKDLVAPKSPFDQEDFNAFGGNTRPTTSPGGTGTFPPGMGEGPSRPLTPPGMSDPYNPYGPQGQQSEGLVPDHCMLRFVDVSVEPGKTYKYRVRVKMNNPNYAVEPGKRSDTYPHFAREETLVSPPVEIPQLVSVPAELHVYAVDQKEVEGRDYKGHNSSEQGNKQKVILQIHRWLDAYYPNPNDRRNSRVVGSWSVAERLGIYRGEYVQRMAKVEVPVKPLDQADFILANDPANRNPREKHLINVPFGDDSVLVDFEGGDMVYRKTIKIGEKTTTKNLADKAATEVLILSPDGKLIAHNSVADKEDSTRTQRLKNWREQIKKLKEGKPSGGTGGSPFGQP